MGWADRGDLACTGWLGWLGWSGLPRGRRVGLAGRAGWAGRAGAKLGLVGLGLFTFRFRNSHEQVIRLLLNIL